ncbi:MAG: carboxyl-terminal processing protease [Candidatus Sumerlaeota bacterium]|nr:carboxyl-terminal processing protease [Candidatus Sumerlaeota bacterium]
MTHRLPLHLLLFLAALLLPLAAPAQTPLAQEDEDFLRFVDAAAELYYELQSSYVEDIDRREVLESALEGMIRPLDEHSQYMTPDILDQLNRDTSGTFSGIGIHISMRQGLPTVIAPIPGTPAAKAGLLPWDRIIEIDGESAEELDLLTVVDKITGPEGTLVELTVFRSGETEPLLFTIERGRIEIESVYHQMLDDSVGHIRIARFSENTAAHFAAAFDDLKAKGAKALVIDVRFNTGGLLREAIDLTDLFVPKGQIIVSTKGRNGRQNREYLADHDATITMPMAVLVNEGTASASEILAGALQDHGLATIIGPEGKNTFGKGSVQTVMTLDNPIEVTEAGNPRNSALRLTTAKYYTPSGRTIHHLGISPDLYVRIPDGHLRNLLQRGLLGDPSVTSSPDEETEPFFDLELEAARRHLRDELGVETPALDDDITLVVTTREEFEKKRDELLVKLTEAEALLESVAPDCPDYPEARAMRTEARWLRRALEPEKQENGEEE